MDVRSGINFYEGDSVGGAKVECGEVEIDESWVAESKEIRSWPAEPKPDRAKAGGRGRNRTFNLSVKSRMLCQLSYASRGVEKSRVIDHLSRLSAEVKIASAPQKIYHRRGTYQSAAKRISTVEISSSLPRECAIPVTAVRSRASALQPSNQLPLPSSGTQSPRANCSRRSAA
jgi:hypothetical protein